MKSVDFNLRFFSVLVSILGVCVSVTVVLYSYLKSVAIHFSFFLARPTLEHLCYKIDNEKMNGTSKLWQNVFRYLGNQVKIYHVISKDASLNTIPSIVIRFIFLYVLFGNCIYTMPRFIYDGFHLVFYSRAMDMPYHRVLFWWTWQQTKFLFAKNFRFVWSKWSLRDAQHSTYSPTASALASHVQVKWS